MSSILAFILPQGALSEFCSDARVSLVTVDLLQSKNNFPVEPQKPPQISVTVAQLPQEISDLVTEWNSGLMKPSRSYLRGIIGPQDDFGPDANYNQHLEQ